VAATGDSEPGVSSSPSPSPTADASALLAALADPRVPDTPAGRKLARLPGRAAPVKGRIKDRRSGISFARFSRGWRLAKASPFRSRQLLPAVRGAGYRGMVVSCPVPTLLQEELRDTAIIAARWTLNLHPEGAKIKWTASQRIEAGDRDGWLLGYRISYTYKGKRHSSMAALAVVDVPEQKPALVFASIPDAQKKRWRDINTVMSSLRPL
jgi:hypothetical protein